MSAAIFKGALWRKWKIECWSSSRPKPQIFTLVYATSLFLFGGHSTSIDEETYLASLRAFLRGSNALDTSKLADGTYLAMPNKSGLLTSFYGFGTVLVNLPFYVFGKIISEVFPAEQREQIIRLFLYSANSFYFSLVAVFLFSVTKYVGGSERIALYSSLTYAFCTYALWAAGTGFSEIPTSLFLLLACYWLIQKSTDRRIFASGLSLGIAVLMRSSAALFIAPLAFFLLYKKTGKTPANRFVTWCLGGLLPGIVFCAVNYWKFGSVFDTGYPKLNYNTPVYEGIYGLFLSLGKGIFWFAPISLIAVWNLKAAIAFNKSVGVLMVSCVAINTVFFARFEIWSGDDAFGPRYMVIVLPEIILLAMMGMNASKWRSVRAFVFTGVIPSVCGATLYVNAVNGGRVKELVGYTGSSAFTPDGSYDWNAIRRLTIFVPSKSQLVSYIENLPIAFWNSVNRVFSIRETIDFSVNNGQQLSWYMKSSRIDVWWLYWIESSGPRIFLVIPVLLMVVIVLCINNLRNYCLLQKIDR